MAQLTKERDHLFETIRTYRLLFETTRQLINEMQGTVPTILQVMSYSLRVGAGVGAKTEDVTNTLAVWW